MNGLDALNSSLYFSATAAASRQVQKEQDKQKSEKVRKSSFASSLEKAQELESLASAGLPVELAGMSVEEAVVYLKDAVDLSADKLTQSLSEANFYAFRKSVSNFLKYVQKHSTEVAKIKRVKRDIVVKGVMGPYFEERRERDPYYQVRVVDAELDKLAAMVMENHGDKLKMLAKVDEIKGLIVDFLAE